MSVSHEPSEKKHFGKEYHVLLVHQYLASLTSEDPFSTHVLPLNKLNLKPSTLGETIEVPPLPTFLHKQVQQIEYPNLLNPNGGSSDHDTILLRARAAQSIITDSKFEVQSILISDAASNGLTVSEDGADDEQSTGATAAVEALWTGTVAKDLDEKLKKGLSLKARFAMFFEFRNGKIFRQRNYDCFDPF